MRLQIKIIDNLRVMVGLPLGSAVLDVNLDGQKSNILMSNNPM